MKHLKIYEDYITIPDDCNDSYYVIHMDKSIEKFNFALKKINFYDEFYDYLDEEDIPNKKVVYIVFEDDGFSIDDNIKPYSDYTKLGDIFVSDLDIQTSKFNI